MITSDTGFWDPPDPAGYAAMVASPAATFGLRTDDARLVGVDFLDPALPAKAARTRFDRRVADEVERYLDDPAAGFSIPLRLDGTPFQQRVWVALRQIASGRVETYGRLATALGTSPRAIGGACRANPCPLVVPCHRVVAVDGLGGFAGQRAGVRLRLKRWLLAREGVELAA